MSRKYELIWEPPHNNVLRIKFLEDAAWKDILEANLLALKLIEAEAQDVVLFNDTQGFMVDQVSIGSIKDLLFNSLPNVSKNLKGVVIFVPSAQKFMLEFGIETLADIRYGKGFMQVVGNYDLAQKLIREKLEGKR